jgi:hypothetical protein
MVLCVKKECKGQSLYNGGDIKSACSENNDHTDEKMREKPQIPNNAFIVVI